MFPPAGLPDPPTQPPPLGGPGLALGDQVVSRPSFAAAAPPALIRLGTSYPVGPDCRMS